MSRKIGLFDTQQQAIDAVQQLLNSGFVPGELQVLAKDAEHSRRIEAESGVHADELRELNETNEADPGVGLFGLGAGGSAPMLAAPVFGIAGFGTTGSAAGAYPLAAVMLDGDDHNDALQAFGLDRKEAELCGAALQQGTIAVIVTTDESLSLLDKDGGPDLSRLAAAEAVFRACNASVIAAGQ
jgi:hypothetical protein